MLMRDRRVVSRVDLVYLIVSRHPDTLKTRFEREIWKMLFLMQFNGNKFVYKKGNTKLQVSQNCHHELRRRQDDKLEEFLGDVVIFCRISKKNFNKTNVRTFKIIEPYDSRFSRQHAKLQLKKPRLFHRLCTLFSLDRGTTFLKNFLIIVFTQQRECKVRASAICIFHNTNNILTMAQKRAQTALQQQNIHWLGGSSRKGSAVESN